MTDFQLTLSEYLKILKNTECLQYYIHDNYDTLNTMTGRQKNKM